MKNSLMCHTKKLFLKIIHNRRFKKLETNIGDTQFGFCMKVDTREAIFSLNVLIQRCLEVNKAVYACYADYVKTFDKVRHDQLLNI